ncbi:MAG: EAL domain-containing protein [Trichlorobacter sp.]|uniref:bifunctional diguanylate cyclase/phosphodiesterase n=1 Tax=Trichlorobacter sp. TaxID=2911007 RepID=UPI00256D9796|nr:EAL domain-containing protein [Trichlorobacter sp.]MDK9716312.1 EAL domain-containing protein [Trichlorobacter sp.]
MNNIRTGKYQLLRQRAEQLLATDPGRFRTPEQADLVGLLHELAVFQAELEMQNEDLLLANQQLEEVRQQYARLYEQAPVGYLRLNEQGIILHHNQTFIEMIHSDQNMLVNKPLATLLTAEDRDIFYARFNALFKNPTGKNIELHFILPHGKSLVTSLTARRDLHCVTTDAVQPTLLVIVSDISEICRTRHALEQARLEAEGTCNRQTQLLIETRKLSRLYLLLSRINQLIVQRPQQQELFREVCDIAVLEGGIGTAWIGSVEKTGEITPLASCGMVLEQLDCLGINNYGTLFQDDKTFINNNLLTEPDIIPWQSSVVACGFQSVAVLPIRARKGHTGCFVLYAKERNFFDEAEIRLLEEISRNIGHSLDVAEMDREQELAREQLSYLARHDPLTGLNNRSMFSSHLSKALERAARQGTLVALLLLDLDRFKDVNDSYGHAAGDELLVQVSKRITGRLRGADSTSRLGGDEFTVVLEDLHEPQDAAWVANDLLALVHEPFQLATAGEVSVGISIGIALYPEHGSTEQELLQQADAALYRAKADGRSRFRFFNEELTREARERIKLEASLRKALEQKELLIHFQPQFDLQTGRIVGAEALVRWLHPEYGMMQPEQFIPLAEETGLIAGLGEWVLRETCQLGSLWLSQGLPPLRLAVNISPQQLRQPGMERFVADTLLETGFPAELLEIEVTESTLMQHEKIAELILNRISSLGVRLAVDDFGTGYSSLSRIKQFPVQLLKIDRSFITGILDNRTDQEVAATIVAMGHTLGFKVLAEGVEIKEQLELLRQLPCDLYQGFLSGRPMPAEELCLVLQEKMSNC